MTDTGKGNFPFTTQWVTGDSQLLPFIGWTNRQNATTQKTIYSDWFFEAVTFLVTANGVLRLESLTAQQNDPKVASETTGNLSTDRRLLLSFLTSARTDATSRNEILLSQSVDSVSRQEWYSILTVDGVLPLETTVNLQSDRRQYLDSISAQQFDSKVQQECLTNNKIDSNLPLETTVNLQSDRQIPAELASKQKNALTLLTETIAQSAIDGLFPVEFLAAQTRDGYTPLEFQASAITVATDLNCPIEILVTQSPHFGSQCELLSQQLRKHPTPAETLRASPSDALLPNSFTASIRTDQQNPLDWGGSILLQIDNAVPLESLATATRDVVTPVETLTGITSKRQLLIETLAAVRSEASVLVAIFSAIASHAPAAFDSLLSLRQDASAPVEWTGQVAVRLDGLLPFEMLTGSAVVDGRLLIEWTAAQPPTPSGRILHAGHDSRVLNVQLSTRILTPANQTRVFS